MSKNFELILKTTDSEGVTVTETTQVRIGTPIFNPPQVNFKFPANVCASPGAIDGPFWPVGENWGFAWCEVNPTVSGDDETGRFFVQYYYDSGNWPNDPARFFHQTYEGAAGTITEDLVPFANGTLNVSSGVGIAGSGFASVADVSGFRKALVVTDSQFYLDTLFPVHNQTTTSGSGGQNTIIENEDQIVDILAAYGHDLGQNQIFSLARLRQALDPNFDRADQIYRTWPSGTLIAMHPWHYVPMYHNDGAPFNVMPRVLVIAEGEQFPLTGLFNVAGTAISGLHARLMEEVASGTQMAIRLDGDAHWYLVSGVADDNTMTIYDYGLTPTATAIALEAVPYAAGSGFVEILAGGSGCCDWTVAFDPTYPDGTAVPDLTAVPFNTVVVQVASGGAPSGTLSYTWEISQLSGDAVTTTTVLGSGSTIYVDYSSLGDGITQDVTVFVSGDGSPDCIKSTHTGFITLQQLFDAGLWRQNLTFGPNQDATANFMNWTRNGFNAASGFFHIKRYGLSPHSSPILSDWRTGTTQVAVPKGAVDRFPQAGTVVMYIWPTGATNPKQIWFRYSGKTSGTGADYLTGLSPYLHCHINYKNTPVNIDSGVGETTVVAATSTQPKNFIFVPVVMNWPFTFVKARLNNTDVQLEDGSRITSARLNGTKQAYWFFGGNMLSKQTNFPLSAGTGQFFGSNASLINTQADYLRTANALPVWVSEGTVCALAPWDSNVTGKMETIVANSWNLGNIGFFYLTRLNLGTLGNVDANETFTLTASDRTYRLSHFAELPGADDEHSLLLTLPLQGKLVVPHYDRAKTLVISYNGLTRTNSDSTDAKVVKFLNCRVEKIGTSVSGAYLQMPLFASIYKECELDPASFSLNLSGVKPTHFIPNPGIGMRAFGFNATWVDVINANTEINGANLPGSIGKPFAGRNTWEEIIPAFPVGGIAQVDPIYRSFSLSATNTTQGVVVGSCVHEDSLIYVKIEDEAEAVPINMVKVGDMIQELGSWREVQMVRSAKHDHCLQLRTNSHQLLVTDQHPIASLDDAGELVWVKAGELGVGRFLFTMTGFERLTHIQEIKLPDSAHFYDLTIEGTSRFFANGILVHNKLTTN